jgi:single-strand DNA-binding protein
MAGVNKAIIVGNLGADPEVRTLESGAKVATIRVATTERYKDRDGNQQENTEWHNIVLWRGLADITERYL